MAEVLPPASSAQPGEACSSELPQEASAAQSSETDAATNELTLTVHHHSSKYDFSFPASATLADLTAVLTKTLSITPLDQKLLISPGKPGLLKPPYPNPSLPLTSLTSKKISLLAPTASDLQRLTRPAPPPQRPASVKAAKPSRTSGANWQKRQAASTYTFGRIVPLPYLPQPERSQRYLERLAQDPGIVATMTKHQFSVGTLTEMNPAEHTTHESRTLGLNRNRGEVIELRLRTDAYDGYRDYKTIRKTLCHELAHNVHGDHDRNFWDLCKMIEGEVERGDWRSGGRAVSQEEFYNPDDGGMGEHVDGGGWEGGEFVLGGGNGSGSGSASGSAVEGRSGETIRERMARAAEERARKGQ
ncbi:hypothetical protein MMC25_000869 [Agyrium rufum]|nr:hypothetical protein [Agyrium rufum]